jgi:hypothetical protein
MRERTTGKPVTARVVRPGQPIPEDDEGLDSSIEERIAAVWELTKLCHAWNQDGFGEPRLQRSVVHIQRPRR